MRLKLALLLSLMFIAPACAEVLPFLVSIGGNGIDGNKTISGTETDIICRPWRFISYSCPASTVHNVPAGTIIQSVNTFTVSGLLAVGPGYPGGRRSLDRSKDWVPGGIGGGFLGGQSPNYNDENAGSAGGGGGGGGCGGGGGNGGGPFGGGAVGGGAFVGLVDGMTGSGGGAGHVNGGGSDGNGGAAGGRLIVMSADAISVPSGGSITANGSNGIAGSNTWTGDPNGTGGGGGGSGGVIALLSEKSINIAGNISAKGAAGGIGFGNPACGGGGGGGGIAYLVAPSITIGGTTTVTGGAGGVTANHPGIAGGAGVVVQVVGTPSLPLCVWLLDHAEQFKKVAKDFKTQSLIYSPDTGVIECAV